MRGPEVGRAGAGGSHRSLGLFQVIDAVCHCGEGDLWARRRAVNVLLLERL